jgi:hypothetical protein
MVPAETAAVWARDFQQAATGATARGAGVLVANDGGEDGYVPGDFAGLAAAAFRLVLLVACSGSHLLQSDTCILSDMVSRRRTVTTFRKFAQSSGRWRTCSRQYRQRAPRKVLSVKLSELTGRAGGPTFKPLCAGS